MTAVLLLSIAAVLGLGYVVGRVHEGCRKGGTLDLKCEIALATGNVRRITREVADAHRRAMRR